MKKIISLVTLTVLVFTLAGCSTEDLQTAIDENATSVTTVSDTVATLSTELTAAKADLAQLQTDLATAQADLLTAQATGATNASDLAAAITDLEGQIASVQASVTALETALATLTAAVGENTAAIDALESVYSDGMYMPGVYYGYAADMIDEDNFDVVTSIVGVDRNGNIIDIFNDLLTTRYVETTSYSKIGSVSSTWEDTWDEQTQNGNEELDYSYSVKFNTVDFDATTGKFAGTFVPTVENTTFSNKLNGYSTWKTYPSALKPENWYFDDDTPSVYNQPAWGGNEDQLWNFIAPGEFVQIAWTPEVLCSADDETNGVLDAAGNACVLDAVKVAESYDGVYYGGAFDGLTFTIESEFDITFNYKWEYQTTSAYLEDQFNDAEYCTADDVTNGVLDAEGNACVLDAVKVADVVIPDLDVDLVAYANADALSTAVLGSSERILYSEVPGDYTPGLEAYTRSNYTDAYMLVWVDEFGSVAQTTMVEVSLSYNPVWYTSTVVMPSEITIEDDIVVVTEELCTADDVTAGNVYDAAGNLCVLDAVKVAEVILNISDNMTGETTGTEVWINGGNTSLADGSRNNKQWGSVLRISDVEYVMATTDRFGTINGYTRFNFVDSAWFIESYNFTTNKWEEADLAVYTIHEKFNSTENTFVGYDLEEGNFVATAAGLLKYLNNEDVSYGYSPEVGYDWYNFIMGYGLPTE